MFPTQKEKKNIMTKMALFSILANLRNIWLSKKQLDSHIWFWWNIPLVEVHLENPPSHIYVIGWRKTLWNTQESHADDLRPHFENHCLTP